MPGRALSSSLLAALMSTRSAFLVFFVAVSLEAVFLAAAPLSPPAAVPPWAKDPVAKSESINSTASVRVLFWNIGRNLLLTLKTHRIVKSRKSRWEKANLSKKFGSRRACGRKASFLPRRALGAALQADRGSQPGHRYSDH